MKTPSKMPTFLEWLKKMGAAVDAIVTPKMCHNPDFQVQGAACNKKKMKK